MGDESLQVQCGYLRQAYTALTDARPLPLKAHGIATL
jgi:hypothetical protein